MNIGIESTNYILNLIDSKRPSDKSDWRKELLRHTPEKPNKTTIKDAMKKRIKYLDKNQIIQDVYKIPYQEAIIKLEKLKKDDIENKKFITELQAENKKLKSKIENIRFVAKKYKNARDMEHLNRMPELNPDLTDYTPISIDTLKNIFNEAKHSEVDIIPTQKNLDENSIKFVKEYEIGILNNISYPKELLDKIEKQNMRYNYYKKLLRIEKKKKINEEKEFCLENPKSKYMEEHIKLKNTISELGVLISQRKISDKEVNDYVASNIRWDVKEINLKYQNDTKTYI